MQLASPVRCVTVVNGVVRAVVTRRRKWDYDVRDRTESHMRVRQPAVGVIKRQLHLATQTVVESK